MFVGSSNHRRRKSSIPVAPPAGKGGLSRGLSTSLSFDPATQSDVSSRSHRLMILNGRPLREIGHLLKELTRWDEGFGISGSRHRSWGKRQPLTDPLVSVATGTIWAVQWPTAARRSRPNLNRTSSGKRTLARSPNGGLVTGPADLPVQEGELVGSLAVALCFRRAHSMPRVRIDQQEHRTATGGCCL